MTFLKRLLSIIIVLAVIAVAVAYILPREVSVARSQVMNAEAEAIFPHVNSMQATEAWSPWLSRDPETVLTYEGPEEGVGNKLTWASEDRSVGNGTQVITASVPNERVETDLDFGAMGTAKAFFALAPGDGGTEVTWGFTTDLGMNPISRWMGLMMDRWVGADYERGLTNLKELVEAG